MRLLLTILGLLSGVGCALGEQPYRHYTAHQDAVAAGELQRGWLPTWVPSSATDIHLQGDIDTNQVWLRFRLSPEVAGALRSKLRPLSAREIADLRWGRPRGAKAWWPRTLVQQVPADDIALNAEIFAAPAEDAASAFSVAFERGTDQVFSWSQPL